MIASMTGFGRGSAEDKGCRIGVELRSVNSRFLDIQVRSPQSLQVFEQSVREQVQKAVGRGKISVYISLEEEGGSGPLPQLDEAVARRYIDEAARLSSMEGVHGDVELAVLMRLPGVFRSGTDGGDGDENGALLQAAIKMALDDFLAMCQSEGAALAADLRSRIAKVEGLLSQIEERVPEARQQVQNRLRERVEELLKPGEVDESRLAMEIALIAERSDIMEEIVRFHSHNGQFLEALEKGGEVGRRFNFLLQEMNREANTISSKAANTPIVHAALEIKEEVERLREQVQNLA